MVWSALSLILWSISFTLFVLCAILYIARGKQREQKSEEFILYGFSSVFIGCVLNRFFVLCAFLNVEGTFQGGVFYAKNERIISGIFLSDLEIFFKAAYVSFLLGYFIIVFSFERIIKRTKFVLSILLVVQAIIVLILPFREGASLYFVNISFVYALCVYIIILFYFTKWSKLELKSISALQLNSALFFGLSMTLANPDFLVLNAIPLYIAPLFFITASIIAITPVTINPEYFSKALKFWYIFGTGQIITMSIFSIYFIFLAIFYGLPYYFSFYAFIVTFLLFLVNYFAIDNIKNQGKREEKGSLPNILAIFSKPKGITEEEVSLYRDKAICLVCKGNIEGFSYICGNCKALYCQKCAISLVSIENLCWACDSPIDKSKPVKKYEQESVKVEFEKKTKNSKIPSKSAK